MTNLVKIANRCSDTFFDFSGNPFFGLPLLVKGLP